MITFKNHLVILTFFRFHTEKYINLERNREKDFLLVMHFSLSNTSEIGDVLRCYQWPFQLCRLMVFNQIWAILARQLFFLSAAPVIESIQLCTLLRHICPTRWDEDYRCISDIDLSAPPLLLDMPSWVDWGLFLRPTEGDVLYRESWCYLGSKRHAASRILQKHSLQ